MLLNQLLSQNSNVVVKPINTNTTNSVDGVVSSVGGNNFKITHNDGHKDHVISYDGVTVSSHTKTDFFFRDRYNKTYYLSIR